MGILFVLLFYALVLMAVAMANAAVLRKIAPKLTKNFPQSKRAIRMATFFPYYCVVFAGIWFLAYAVINSNVLHRDPGFGDSWETPLFNGYSLMMIDTTDQGAIRDQNYQTVINGVRQLQVANRLIFGANDSGYLDRLGDDSKFVDSYFELNTLTGRLTGFTTLDQLRQRAASEGAQLHLREFQAVYWDYRTTWFDYLAKIILFLIPATGFILMSRWIWRLRTSTSSLTRAGA
jgi:hypothetical protein